MALNTRGGGKVPRKAHNLEDLERYQTPRHVRLAILAQCKHN